MKNAQEYLKELVHRGDRAELICLMADLLSGAYVVDVNTGMLEEAEYGATLHSSELRQMLRALGIQSIPIALLDGMGDRLITYNTNNDILIGQLTESIQFESAKGLLCSLIDGTTQVEAGTDKVLYCYGQEKKSYVTIKELFGNITVAYAQAELVNAIESVDDEKLALVTTWITLMQ